MNEYHNLAKLIAIGILGGVVKNLFGPPPAPVTHIHNHPEPTKPELETLKEDS